MSDYYDRDGKPMLQNEWAAKFEDMEYRRIGATTLPNGLYVSTVWLGLDHNYGEGPPLIFESMVFAPRGSRDLDCERYSTLAEAKAGHKRMVEKWRTRARSARTL